MGHGIHFWHQRIAWIRSVDAMANALNPVRAARMVRALLGVREVTMKAWTTPSWITMGPFEIGNRAGALFGMHVCHVIRESKSGRRIGA